MHLSWVMPSPVYNGMTNYNGQSSGNGSIKQV